MTVVDTDETPLRANASIVRVGDEIILFGGEYFDGAVNYCFNEVFRYNLVSGCSTGRAPLAREGNAASDTITNEPCF